MSNEKKKSFSSLFEELNGVPFAPEGEAAVEEDFSLTEEMDHTILMHRDAHFGGDFEVMLKYYQNEDHVGVDPDLDISRIAYLSEVETSTGKNLASVMLNSAEIEQIARCRRAYAQFKEIYEQQDENASARLLADLVLSEEQYPHEAIDAVVERGDELAPLLIELIRSDDAYLPLFPGYGYAPFLAAQCLSKIKHPDALIHLFNMFHHEAIFSDDTLLDAFAEIGEEAKQFLMTRVKGRPITRDNTHAAFALCVFASDLEVAKLALEQLSDPHVQCQSLLCTYLLCLCDPLQNDPQKQALISLGNKANIPKELHLQIKNLVRDWH